MINVGLVGIGFMGMIHYLAYQRVRMRKEPEQSGAQLATEVRRVYAEQLAEFNAAYAARYAYIGTRVSA